MSEKAIKISVVIPSYNPGKMIVETLDSLVAQTYKNFEVILSDDGSTDETLKIANTYSEKLNLIIINNINSGGPAKPRNSGIRKARGEWIAFLDHDDTWYPTKLEEVEKSFNDFDVIYHDLDIVNNKSEVTGRTILRKVDKKPFVDLVVNGNAIANSGAITKKELIERAGFVEESKDFTAGEDFDLWIKVAKETSKFLYINKSLGQYRVEPGQNLSQPTVGLIEVHRKIYERYKNSLNEKEQLYAFANVSYKAARMYHGFGMTSEAWKNYKLAFDSNSINIKLKAIIGSFLLIFTGKKD